VVAVAVVLIVVAVVVVVVLPSIVVAVVVVAAAGFLSSGLDGCYCGGTRHCDLCVCSSCNRRCGRRHGCCNG
jgi:hypothetical protein